MMNGDNVLVLTPNSGLRLRITRILAKEGYSVTSVLSVEEAIEVLRRQPCDLLLIGLEDAKLLDMLVARFPPEMSVIIITTADKIQQTAVCPGLGLHSFLVAPFTAKTLRVSVAKVMDKTHLVREGIRSKVLADLEPVNQALATKARISRSLKLIVEAGAAKLGADFTALSVKDKTTGKFVVRAEWGEHRQLWQRLSPQVMEIRKPLLLDEASLCPLLLCQLMAEAGVSALVHVPLLTERRVSGAIDLIKVGEKGRFTTGDLSFASILGWWSSIILERSTLSTTLQKQRRQMERLLHEIVVSQENEQRRIAVDIHDGVAQWLVAATYDVRACLALLAESRFADLESELAKLAETLQKSTRELRRVITGLRPSLLVENGMVSALHQRLRQLEEEDGIRSYFEIEDELPEFTFAQASTVYWIVQEALTNVKRHSKASEVRLCMRCQDNLVTVEVRDNGQGFNPTQVMDSSITLEHMGLLGMTERAELLGSSLKIESSPGKGTSIVLSFLASPQLAMPTGEER